jgi:hypothetical protein
MDKVKSRRKHSSQFQERIWKNIWLVVPLGLISMVVVLAVMNQKQKTFEPLTVITPGITLPPQKIGTMLPGTKFPDLGQQHIPEGQRVTYNSNPPTSGSHYAIPASWGIYSKEPPVDERLVHNLEHGGIIISYKPELLGNEELEKLKAQLRSLSSINPRIILVPRANLDSAIALTAWGYLQKLKNFDPIVIRAFYDAHIARSPECQNGLCPL